MAVINGKAYQFSNLSVEIIDDASGNSINVIEGFTEASYSDSMSREKLYGASRSPVAMTEGQYEAEGSITMYREVYDALQAAAEAAGKAFYELKCSVSIAYAYQDQEVVVDTLKFVQFSTRDASHSEGADALTISCDMEIGDVIYWNGKHPFDQTRNLK